MRKITQAFKTVLARKGLLHAYTGTALAHGIDGEDRLLKKWQDAAAAFIYKGRHIEVDMRIERLVFNQTRCSLIVYNKCDLPEYDTFYRGVNHG